MKKYISISLFVFWAIVTATLVAGLVFYDRNKTSLSVVSPVSTSSVISIASSSDKQNGLTVVEVSKHNKDGDCWVVVDNKVYDVTKLVSIHPGGAKAILSSCGLDGSAIFNSKHDARAKAVLNNYLIGPLVKNSSSVQTESVPVVSSKKISDEEDD